ncbi:MAG: hypothetical protein ABMA64_08075 [Myxococcota bacterium]
MFLAMLACGGKPSTTDDGFEFPTTLTQIDTDDETWTDTGSTTTNWTRTGTESDSGTWTTDTGTPGTTDPVVVATPFDLQQGAVAEGTTVELRGVVVTATGDFGFYVQDPAGGAWSAVWVFGDLGWDAVWPVELGDELKVTGVYEEYFDLTEVNLASGAGDVRVTGSGDLPTPEVVAVAELEPPAAEDWEGVLVQVDDVTLADPDLGAGRFSVSQGAASVVVGAQLYGWDASELPVGAGFASIVGVLNFDDGEFVLEPRDADDVSAYASTPYALQRGEVDLGAEVELYSLAVTAVDEDGVFAQDEAGGPESGIWVYLGTGWEYTWGSLVPGDRIDVSGTLNEYYDLTEVDLFDSTRPWVGWVGSGALPAPEVVAVGDLGEEWESVLVEIQDVELVDPDLGFGQWLVQEISGLDQVIVDDELHDWSGAATMVIGDRFDAIRGPLNYTFGVFAIEPRAEPDVDPR